MVSMDTVILSHYILGTLFSATPPGWLLPLPSQLLISHDFLGVAPEAQGEGGYFELVLYASILYIALLHLTSRLYFGTFWYFSVLHCFGILHQLSRPLLKSMDLGVPSTVVTFERKGDGDVNRGKCRN